MQKVLVLFLLALTACTTTSPVPTVLPSVGITPTSTTTPVPTLTLTPSSTTILTLPYEPTLTSTPEVEKYDFNSAVNVEKIPMFKKWFVGASNTLQDLSEAAGQPFIFAAGFITSYRLVDNGSGPEFYVSFIYKDQIVRARIDYFLSNYSNNTISSFEISKLTPDQAIKISSYLNQSFNQINSTATDYENFSGSLLLTSINNPDEAKKCEQRVGIEPRIVKDICAYVGNTEYIHSQDLVSHFNNSLVAITGNQFEDFKIPESINPLLSSHGEGVSISVQVNPGTY